MLASYLRRNALQTACQDKERCLEHRKIRPISAYWAGLQSQTGALTIRGSPQSASTPAPRTIPSFLLESAQAISAPHTELGRHPAPRNPPLEGSCPHSPRASQQGTPGGTARTPIRAQTRSQPRLSHRWRRSSQVRRSKDAARATCVHAFRLLSAN